VISSEGSTDLSLAELCTFLDVDPAKYQGYVLVLAPAEDQPEPTLASDTANVGNILYLLGYAITALSQQVALDMSNGA
jgi:hypothetical protein